jgi:hypothetical protein
MIGVSAIQHEATGLKALVVTGNAVLVKYSAGRGLRRLRLETGKGSGAQEAQNRTQEAPKASHGVDDYYSGKAGLVK